MSSSRPETPFLNSVTLFPSERITLGRRLPKISKETNATTINSVVPRLGRKASGIMGSSSRTRGRGSSRAARDPGEPSARGRRGGEDDHAGRDPGGHGGRGGEHQGPEDAVAQALPNADSPASQGRPGRLATGRAQPGPEHLESAVHHQARTTIQKEGDHRHDENFAQPGESQEGPNHPRTDHVR